VFPIWLPKWPLENLWEEFGHEMRMLVLYGKEASIVPPTLDASAAKQDEMKGSKDYDVFIKKKTNMMMKWPKYLP
jgi:hypothetical protein